MPFIRSTSSGRVKESANLFIEAFQRAKSQDASADKRQNTPKIDVEMKFENGFKMTLHHNTCLRFEKTHHTLKTEAMKTYGKTWLPKVQKRLRGVLKGVKLNIHEIFELMELCAFQTVADAFETPPEISEICNIFHPYEWDHFDYTQSVGKYYAYGNGNKLGPAQGIGFANELYARLPGNKVKDETSFNPSLKFPPGQAIYLDFTHDNGIVSILAALGLYDDPLPQKQRLQSFDIFSSGRVVPFAARTYIEKLECDGEEFVRVIVNDRVVRPHGCEPEKFETEGRKDAKVMLDEMD